MWDKKHKRPDKERRMLHYNAADINDKLIIDMRDLSHIMRVLFEGRGSQKRVLIILNKTESITQRELTERLGIQPGSASEVIAKLESAGLIERTPSVSDRRTADIRLTDTGKARAEEAAEQRKKRHIEMFSCLSDGEKETLLALMEKLYSDWEKRYCDKD